MGLYNEFKNSKISAHGIPARIMVIGVGGAGGNTVDHIYTLSIKGVNLMICNTDSKALDKSPLNDTQKICMGDGKGAGNDAKVGEDKAKEALPAIREYVQQNNPDLIFLTAGMGGGTGTGAAPVVAQMIDSLGIPLIAILTTPAINEGNHRFEQAMKGIAKMQDYVDTFIIIKNETIIQLYEDKSVVDAFNMANDIVAFASKGIAEIALTQSDLVSVDISDVCKVVRNSHYAVMGMASEAGEDRAVKAIQQAVLSPLFGDVPLKGSKSVLVNFATSASDGLKMKEVNKALDYIQSIAAGEDQHGDRDPVNIIWGTSIKPDLEDKIEVIIVVTGFHADSYYHQAFGGKLNFSPSKNSKTVDPTALVDVEPTPAPATIQRVEPKVVTPTTTPTPATEPVKPVVQTPQPVVQSVVQKPAEIVKPAEPAQPKIQPTEPVKPVVQPTEPVQPKVQPVQPTQTTQPTQPVQPAQPKVEEVVEANEAWRVPIPVRVPPKAIPPKSVVSAYKVDTTTPAYKNRRGLMLINEIRGKKVTIKMDGSHEESDQSTTTTLPKQQSLLDF